MIFTDRLQAGKLLAEKLSLYRGSQSQILGLARGGVVVAAAIAQALNLPIDVLVVKKISSPTEAELAIGAMAPDGVFLVDWKLAQRMGVDEDYVNKSQIPILNEQIRQKTLIYRKGRKPLSLRGKTVIVVDDGAATGATVETAVRYLKKKHAGKIVVALPVAPPDTVGKIRPEVDELVVVETPADFSAVGQFYEHFDQVEDGEVVELLKSDK